VALRAPGVERRIDVDHVERARRQVRQDAGCVALDEKVVIERDGRVERSGAEHPHGRPA